MKKQARQYTIRNIPADVDRVLRKRAKETGLSFNQVAIEALARGAGEAFRPARDFSGIIGSISAEEASRMDEEIRKQRQIDPALWDSMRIAIDSNRYTDFCRGIPAVVEVMTDATEIHVPLIVIGEQRAGFAHGNSREKNERLLTRFLDNEGIFRLNPDDQTTFFYADLYVYLRKKGRPIPTNDLWIAALCVQHGLTLFDRDSDFDHLPQLARISLG